MAASVSAFHARLSELLLLTGWGERGKGERKSNIRLYLRTSGCRQGFNMHFQEYSVLCFQ